MSGHLMKTKQRKQNTINNDNLLESKRKSFSFLPKHESLSFDEKTFEICICGVEAPSNFKEKTFASFKPLHPYLNAHNRPYLKLNKRETFVKRMNLFKHNRVVKLNQG